MTTIARLKIAHPMDEIERILRGDSVLSLIYHQGITQQRTAIQSSLLQACTNQRYQLCQLDGHNVSEDALLRRIDLGQAEVNRDISNYRQIASIIEQVPRGVIVIHDAHGLIDGGARIVARIARLIDRLDSRWKIILFADTKDRAEVDALSIPLDAIYQQADNRGRSAARSKSKSASSKLPAVLITIAMLGAGIAILLAPYNRPSNMSEPLGEDEESQAIEMKQDDAHSPPQVAAEPSLSVTPGLDDSQWLSDEEFNSIMARFADEEQRTEAISTSVSQPNLGRTRTTKRRSSSNEMMLAVAASDLDRVDALLTNGEHVDATDALSKTALMNACIVGNAALVDLLLSHDAGVNLTDNQGHSALYYAAVGGHSSITKLLLANGAKVNLPSKLDKTPLMAAAYNNYPVLVSILLEYGADLSIRDHSGWNALFYAVWNNNLAVVKLLVAHGADLRQTDNDGNSISAIAGIQNDAQILQALRLQ